MYEEVECADNEESSWKSFELFGGSHRRRVINKLVGRDILAVLQIGPASDILVSMPYELASHFVGVEVVRAASAIVEHRIDKHCTLYRHVALVLVPQCHTGGQSAACAFAHDDDIVTIHMQFITMFMDIAQTRVCLIQLYVISVRRISSQRIFHRKHRGPEPVGHLSEVVAVHRSVACSVAASMTIIHDRCLLVLADIIGTIEIDCQCLP